MRSIIVFTALLAVAAAPVTARGYHAHYGLRAFPYYGYAAASSQDGNHFGEPSNEPVAEIHEYETLPPDHAIGCHHSTETVPVPGGHVIATRC